MGGVLGRMKSASVDVSVNVAMRKRRSGTPFPVLQLIKMIDSHYPSLPPTGPVAQKRAQPMVHRRRSRSATCISKSEAEILPPHGLTRRPVSHLHRPTPSRSKCIVKFYDMRRLRRSSREQSRRLSATGRLNLPLKSSPPTYGSSTTGTKAFAAMPFPPSQEGTAQPLSPTRIKWTHSSTPSFPLLLL